ncbi:enoyl-CoA hydratase-related protein [Candidatus Zixiibacteriota bacterium]
MDYQNLILSSEGGIGLIKLNRSDALNALNTQTFDELSDALERFNRDKAIGAIIITGQGKAFVAGADIAELRNMDPFQAKRFSLKGQGVFDQIEALEKPVIAAVNGFCLGGGCELAMACDMRIASDKAKFGQPEVNLGVTPGFAGTQRLPRLIGEGRAKELLFTGDIIDAQTACSYGLVNKVVPADQLMDHVMALAEKINSKGPLAISLAKSVVHKGLQVDLVTGGAMESDAFALCFASGQAPEGMAAFLEKRKPEWGKKTD